MKISRPDYDKPYRCPGWSGAGWRLNKVDWCDTPEHPLRWRLNVYTQPWRRNWIRRTLCCNTVVLPLWVKWFEIETWRWELRKLRWSDRAWRKGWK